MSPFNVDTPIFVTTTSTRSLEVLAEYPTSTGPSPNPSLADPVPRFLGLGSGPAPIRPQYGFTSPWLDSMTSFWDVRGRTSLEGGRGCVGFPSHSTSHIPLEDSSYVLPLCWFSFVFTSYFPLYHRWFSQLLHSFFIFFKKYFYLCFGFQFFFLLFFWMCRGRTSLEGGRM